MAKEILRTSWDDDGQAAAQPRNIYQELHRTLSIMEHPHTGRSQDDVPSGRILLYVIKDYQRMQDENVKLKQKIEDKKRKWENNDVLKKQRDKLAGEVRELQNRLTERDSQLAELRQGRDAVVRAMTDDLQSELKATRLQLKDARQTIVSLADMIADGDDGTQPRPVIDLSRVLHPDTDEEQRQWMTTSLDRLETALLRLTDVENCLNMYLAATRNAVTHYEDFSSFKSNIKKLDKSCSRIHSACDLISQFFEKVGDIRIEKTPSAATPE